MPGRRWLSVVTTVLLLTAVVIPPAVRAEAPPTAPVSTPTAPVPQPAAPVPGASSGNVRPSEATPPFTRSQTDQRDAWGGTTNPQGTPIATPKGLPSQHPIRRLSVTGPASSPRSRPKSKLIRQNPSALTRIRGQNTLHRPVPLTRFPSIP